MLNKIPVPLILNKIYFLEKKLLTVYKFMKEFDSISLFNGISVFVGYLMPKQSL